MAAQDTFYDVFKKNAELVAAKVCKIGSFSEAIDYVAALVREDTSRPRGLAAPELSDAELEELEGKVQEIKILQKDLHTYSDGISFAITNAEFGISKPLRFLLWHRYSIIQNPTFAG